MRFPQSPVRVLHKDARLSVAPNRFLVVRRIRNELWRSSKYRTVSTMFQHAARDGAVLVTWPTSTTTVPWAGDWKQSAGRGPVIPFPAREDRSRHMVGSNDQPAPAFRDRAAIASKEVSTAAGSALIPRSSARSLTWLATFAGHVQRRGNPPDRRLEKQWTF